MGQVCLVSGPPGCGKTTWVLETLKQHQGACAFLRLEGIDLKGWNKVSMAGSIRLGSRIRSLNWLRYSHQHQGKSSRHDGQLTLIEVQQFRAQKRRALMATQPASVSSWMHSTCNRIRSCTSAGIQLLPTHDTLEFTKLGGLARQP